MPASSTRVANMPVVSTAWLWAVRSMPSPRPPIVNSPTTAPVTDRVRPLRSPVRMWAVASGSSTCHSSVPVPAPSSRAAFTMSRGIWLIPSAVLSMIGKNTMMAQSTTIGRKPGPIHRSSSGASAMAGIAWDAAAYGSMIRPATADFATRYPSGMATAAARVAPVSASPRVVRVAGTRFGPRRSASSRVTTADGAGRKTGFTRPSRPTASQSARTRSPKVSGSARRSAK